MHLKQTIVLLGLVAATAAPSAFAKPYPLPEIGTPGWFVLVRENATKPHKAKPNPCNALKLPWMRHACSTHTGY